VEKIAGTGKEQENCRFCGGRIRLDEKLGIYHSGCVEIEYPPFEKQIEWQGGGFSQTRIPTSEVERTPKVK